MNSDVTDGLSTRRTLGTASAGLGLLILCVLAFWVGMILHRSHKIGLTPPRGPELWLVFPDIGNGDSMLVRDPSTDRAILIDTGGDEQSAKEILTSMRQNGVAHLDGILLLSPRAGSVGGLPYLINQTRVAGPVLLPCDADLLTHHGGEAARAAMAALHEHGLRAWPLNHNAARAESLFGANSLVQIAFLSVPPNLTNASQPSGDPLSSFAMRIDYGASGALYEAALRPSEEDRLLAGDRDDLACDVLSVADGGSAQTASSEFLTMAGPRVATITTPEGHPPADDTLQRLHAAGVEVGQTSLLNSFTLRLGRYPEEPILWSESQENPLQQTNATH